MARFPGNKTFAFTVFDDTDASTVENVGPVYQCLSDLGFRTTKSVWPLPLVPEYTDGGSTGGTLSDREYLKFVRRLQNEGFEIALHSVRNYDSTRDMIELGIQAFSERLGCYPRTHTNHHCNRDNLYWGANRLATRVGRAVGRAWSSCNRTARYEGHVEASPFFWGDICKQHIQYVRNFTFEDVNTMRVNPTLPYHDPTKPFVNFWFTSCEGAEIGSFCDRIDEASQDRLEAEGGACIMYTHFAEGFSSDGIVNPRFKSLLERLSRKNGWFVPVAELLDFLRTTRTDHSIQRSELASLERRWLTHKLRHRGSR